jgi:hypothetical protein
MMMMMMIIIVIIIMQLGFHPVAVNKYSAVLATNALWPTQPTTHSVAGLARGVKRSERGVDNPPKSSAEVNERVELYLYSPSGPSRPVLG